MTDQRFTAEQNYTLALRLLDQLQQLMPEQMGMRDIVLRPPALTPAEPESEHQCGTDCIHELEDAVSDSEIRANELARELHDMREQRDRWIEHAKSALRHLNEARADFADFRAESAALRTDRDELKRERDELVAIAEKTAKALRTELEAARQEVERLKDLAHRMIYFLPHSNKGIPFCPRCAMRNEFEGQISPAEPASGGGG